MAIHQIPPALFESHRRPPMPSDDIIVKVKIKNLRKKKTLQSRELILIWLKVKVISISRRIFRAIGKYIPEKKG